MLGYISGTSVNLLLLVITWFTFGLKAFALVDCSLRPTAAFAATGKLTKLAWVGILAAAFLFALIPLSPLNLLNLAGDVGAIVYLVDVRPAIRGLGDAGSIRRRRPGGGSGGGSGGGASGW